MALRRAFWGLWLIGLLSTLPMVPVQAQQDTCEYAFDNDCDEARYGGTGYCAAGTDASDCRFFTGALRADAAGGNTCTFAYDNECDEARFGGTGVCLEGTDAYDCARSPTGSSGPNSCHLAHDTICDHPIFGGTYECAMGTDTADCGPLLAGHPDGCGWAFNDSCEDASRGGSGHCPAGTDTTDCNAVNGRSNRASGGGSYTPPEVNEAIASIQQGLNALGYDAGPVDGLFGRRTSSAIRDFQEDVGLAATGQPDEEFIGVFLAVLEEAFGDPGGNPAVADAAESAGPLSDADRRPVGTGFLINISGNLVTNQHVVDGCRDVGVLVDSRDLDAEVIAEDVTNDLAVVRLTETLDGVIPLFLRDDPSPRVGESIMALGFPLQGLLSSGGTLTEGIINSTRGLGDDIRFMQISAQVAPGNSGGPVFDMRGNVVGVVTLQLNSGSLYEETGITAQDVNFAIHLRTLQAFLEAYDISFTDRDRKGDPMDLETLYSEVSDAVLPITCR